MLRLMNDLFRLLSTARGVSRLRSKQLYESTRSIDGVLSIMAIKRVIIVISTLYYCNTRAYVRTSPSRRSTTFFDSR